MNKTFMDNYDYPVVLVDVCFARADWSHGLHLRGPLHGFPITVKD
jgi:hypothetical protein